MSDARSSERTRRPTPPARLARVFAAGARMVRRAGWLDMDDHDIGGLSHDAAYMLRWLLRIKLGRRPGWPQLEQSWERHAAALHFDDAPVADLGRWQLLSDNVEALDVRTALRERAQRSIRLVTYGIVHDPSGWRTAEELIAAARRGVQVQVILDEQIVARLALASSDQLEMIERMRGSGVEVLFYRDPDAAYTVNHKKILVVDSEVAIIGGRNVGDTYFTDLWRDVDILVRGEPVAAFEAIFEAMRAGILGDPHARPRSARGPGWEIVTFTSATEERSWPSMAWLLHLIERAERTLDIEHAYFFNFEVLERALRRAIARGVRVRVLTNSPESHDLPLSRAPAMRRLSPLVDSGIELHLWKGVGRLLHSKYMVVDDRIVMVGSSNFNPASLRWSGEVDLVAAHPPLAAECTRFFEEGLASTGRLRDRDALDALISRNPLERLGDRFLYDFV